MQHNNASCTIRPQMRAMCIKMTTFTLFQTSSARFFNCCFFDSFDLREKPLTVEENQSRMRRREDSPWRDCFNSSFPSTLTVSVVLLWHGWPFRLQRCARSAPRQAEKATPCLRNQAATLPTHHRLHAHNKNGTSSLHCCTNLDD